MARTRHILLLITLYYISTIEAALSHIRTTQQIKDGETCVEGQVYKKDCNSCHCIYGSRLACTKMACLRTLDWRASKRQVCVPGQFYTEGCRRCFCSEDKQLLCGLRNCQTAGKLPTKHEDIHAHTKYTPSEQHKLPALEHQASLCEPGSSYRVDCNTCLCLASGNLVCGQMLCPSHDDVITDRAKNMSGKPCDQDDKSQDLNVECIVCQCVDGSKVCRPKQNCVPTKKHEPIEENSDKKCTPGMMYKRACNKCYCAENGVLQCTMKTCLNQEQVGQFQRLRKLIRKHWVDYTFRKSNTATTL